MSELLSVIIPTHDRPERLREAAQSVLMQSYPFIELVIVDDGSASSTARTIDELVARDRRVVAIRLEGPQGSSSARNAGLASAGGDLVAFCDDDDIWLPGAASAAVEAMKPSVGVAYGWHEVLLEATGRRVTFRTSADCSPTVMRWINVPWILSGIVRRSVVGDTLSFDPTLSASEDWDLWLRCADIAPMTLVRTALYRYVQHGGERVSRDLAGLEGHERFIEKHRSSMSPACLAYHELTAAVARRDRAAVAGYGAATLAHPTGLGPAGLLAAQLLMSRTGRASGDPGLSPRFAAAVVSRLCRQPRGPSAAIGATTGAGRASKEEDM